MNFEAHLVRDHIPHLHHPMSNITRRQFLEDSILAAAAAVTVTVPTPATAAEQRPVSANDKISVAILGCGIRGKQHADELAASRTARSRMSATRIAIARLKSPRTSSTGSVPSRRPSRTCA